MIDSHDVTERGARHVEREPPTRSARPLYSDPSLYMTKTKLDYFPERYRVSYSDGRLTVTHSYCHAVSKPSEAIGRDLRSGGFQRSKES